jgi:trk system potassium uptake protein TrkA
VNVILLGAGEHGFFLAEELSRLEHNVCVLEADAGVAAEAREKLDARVLEGNGCSVTLLEEAGVSECDLFLGLSSGDNTNVVAASVAKALGAAKVIARVHSSVQLEQWIFDYRTRFEIDYLFSTEHLAAVELAKFLRHPQTLLVEEMAGGRVELQRIEAEPGCAAEGRSLGQLRLPPRIRIGLIERDGHSLVPGAGEIVRAGDRVLLFGNPRDLPKWTEKFRRGGESKAAGGRVVIFGGGEYGLRLARMLEGTDFRVRLFERDRRRCEQLAAVLKNTTLIHADATSARILREEQAGAADFFVAASEDDEDNVMACLQAADLGAGKCVTLIHRADYADILSRSGKQMGIAGAVSPREATRRDLGRFFTTDRLHTVARVGEETELVEFVLPPDSALHGRKVSEVDWPPGTGLVCCARGSVARVPGADDELRAGDWIFAMVTGSSKAAFRRLVL